MYINSFEHRRCIMTQFVCFMWKGWGAEIKAVVGIIDFIMLNINWTLILHDCSDVLFFCPDVCLFVCLCSLLLDNERWKQAEVPAEFQDLVNSIADGRITLPERKIPGPQK